MRDHLPFIPTRVRPKDVSNIQPSVHLPSTRKSKDRLNDQLIPNPTDINIGEKMLQVAVPKEHPYSSHISRFAMFPSLRCPEDPHSGVRAASQPTLNPLIPRRAPEVTVLNKAIGGPYRQETMHKSERSAIQWPGQHGFWEHAKPLKGVEQVFYPTPPKTMLPNPKLRQWEISLSERTANMLKNLERSYWLTSYQMHYTGSGPTNPIKLDDFREKLITTGRMSSHTTPLRERSFPVFVPSKPKLGRIARKIEGRYPPPATQPSASPKATADTQIQDGSATPRQQHGPYEIPARDIGTPHSVLGHSDAEFSKGITGAKPTELSKVVDSKMLKNQLSNRSYYHGEIRPRERENRTVWFEDGQVLTETTEAHSVIQDRTSPALSIQPAAVESEAEVAVVTDTENEKKQPAMRPLLSKPGILSRPPILPYLQPLGTAVDRGNDSSLLELQESFRKWKAHDNFISTIPPATVNLRDNIHTGKKHNFYGINGYFLRG